NGAITKAIAPVAAEIIPGRPPTKAMMTAIQKEAYKPTIGSTPARMEKAIASGIKAKATTVPARISALIFENHSFLIFSTTYFYTSYIYNNSMKTRYD